MEVDWGLWWNLFCIGFSFAFPLSALLLFAYLYHRAVHRRSRMEAVKERLKDLNHD